MGTIAMKGKVIGIGKKNNFMQGRRKQFFSGQANQPQSYVYREFRVMSGHKCKLLCDAQSACIAC